MSTTRLMDSPFVATLNEIRSSWGWFLTLGIALSVLGLACIVGNIVATFATVLILGWLLLFSGILALVHAFHVRSWNGFFLYFLSALLRGFCGYLLIRYPTAGAITLTLILALFLIVGGIFRAVGSSMLKFPSWGWAAFSGMVSVVLGLMLFMQMPTVSVWFIGFAIGVDMVFDGASLMAFAMALQSLPTLYKIKAA